MLWNGIEEKMQDKTFWIVTDEGWCYSNVIGVCFTKEEAISLWENTTKKKWSEIDYKAYAKSDHTEGHWYYGLEEKTFAEFIAIMEERIANRTIINQAKEISKRADNHLRYEIEQSIRKEYKEYLAPIIKSLERI